MWLFFLRRLLLAILACMTVMVISFTLTRLSGNLAASIAGPNASAADIAIITKNYGLDRPLPVQFLDWARHAAEGDLGRSYLYHTPVASLIRDRLPVTLTLGLMSVGTLTIGNVVASSTGACSACAPTPNPTVAVLDTVKTISTVNGMETATVGSRATRVMNQV